MKECKIITINDASEVELMNQDFHRVTELPWTESVLNQYLNEGYVISHIVPEVMPAVQEEGNYTFFKGGFTFFLERETEHDVEMISLEE